MKTSKPQNPEQYQVSEGISGNYHYHLSPKGSIPVKGICGAQTMLTHIPVSSWGTKDHLGSSWCEKCRALAFPKTSPSQQSLTAQLREVVDLANQNGLYDAADFVKSYLERVR